MRVLVTRPQAKALNTCARLREMGHQPLNLPLFQPVHFAETRRDVLRRNDWSALAVTSAEALHGLDADQDTPGMKDRPVFAVGKSTSSVARAAGFTHVITGEGDGQSLAQTIAAQWSQTNRRPLLYLAGSPRAPAFERTLSNCGISFEAVTVYAMQPVLHNRTEIEALIENQPPHAILFYSRASTERFFATDALRNIVAGNKPPQLLCISKNASEPIPPELSGFVTIAHRPEEKSLLALLAKT